MKSWRTSIFGALGVIAGAIVASDFGPLVTKIAGCVGTMASGLGLLFARDSAASKKAAEMAAKNGGEVPIKRRIPLPLVAAVGLALGLAPARSEPRPAFAVMRPADPPFPRAFLVTTVQLPGESLRFDFAEDVQGPWRFLAEWETLPIESPPQLVTVSAPGEWLAADGKIRGFVRVTGNLSPLP